MWNTCTQTYTCARHLQLSTYFGMYGAEDIRNAEYIHTHINTRLLAHIHTETRIHVHKHTFTLADSHKYTWAHTRTHTHMSIHLYVISD